MKFLSCGVTWGSHNSFMQAENEGVLLTKKDQLAKTFDVVRSRDNSKVLGTIETAHTGIYRPDGVAVSYENIKYVHPDTLFVPSKLAGGLLCADLFSGVVVGYSPTYLDEVTVECDEAAVEIAHFLFEKPGFTHEVRGTDSSIILKIVREHYFDAFIILRIFMGGDFIEISMLPDGGNLYTIDDSIAIKKVRSLI